MTVKELMEALSHFPPDREVYMHVQKGFISYDEADYWSGPAEVNCLEESVQPINRRFDGAVKLCHLTDNEIDSEFRAREVSERYYAKNKDAHPDWVNHKSGKIYIKSRSGKGNYKEFENKIV